LNTFEETKLDDNNLFLLFTRREAMHDQLFLEDAYTVKGGRNACYPEVSRCNGKWLFLPLLLFFFQPIPYITRIHHLERVFFPPSEVVHLSPRIQHAVDMASIVDESRNEQHSQGERKGW
jgi:hypothetical protein